VLRFGKKDNFWEMGESGPCGPCSEIHIDRGQGLDPRDGADRSIGVNAGNERFMELWNLVFMQFNRLEDGTLRPLPARHVDTGMGFERILGVLQGKFSNYDTDLFTPIFEHLSELSGRKYGGGEAVDVAFRVAADHVRAVAVAIADGALPSNTGRGYVLRRLVRRASRYARQHLELERPFLCELSGTVASVLGGAFPELVSRKAHVAELLRQEEESFGRTLGRGLVHFEELLARIPRKDKTLPGGEAFDLYATYGFPRDLVELMARERGLELDRGGWEQAQERHQSASRSEGRFKALLSAEQLEGLPPTRSSYHGGGALALELETALVRWLAGDGEQSFAVLEQSPFYPEGGGQVGDAGTIEALDGSFRFEVEDTRALGSVVVHVGRAVGSPRPGRVRARVDGVRRARTARNHTATHILHRALKDVLGEHVVQQGSYVGPDRLRFDFAHPKGLEPQELERVEALVNERIFGNAEVSTSVEELEAAKARGVVALFGEKYEDRVRVVDLGGWSTELCGGTHVRAAGDIGPFVVLSERALAAGVRRIEAVTGAAAVLEVQRTRRALQEAARALKSSPDEVGQRVLELQERLKQQKKQQEKSSATDIDAAFGRMKQSRREARSGGETIQWAVLEAPELDGKALRTLADRAKKLGEDQALAMFGREGDKVPYNIYCGARAIACGLDAAALARAIRPILGGGGGGQPGFAQGQGLSPGNLPRAVELLRAIFADPSFPLEKAAKESAEEMAEKQAGGAQADR
jgi:alanyl-tRNA synthetase